MYTSMQEAMRIMVFHVKTWIKLRNKLYTSQIRGGTMQSDKNMNVDEKCIE